MIKIDWSKYLYERGIFGYCLWIGDRQWAEHADWNMIIITPERRSFLQLRKLKGKLLPVVVK